MFLQANICVCVNEREIEIRLMRTLKAGFHCAAMWGELNRSRTAARGTKGSAFPAPVKDLTQRVRNQAQRHFTFSVGAKKKKNEKKKNPNPALHCSIPIPHATHPYPPPSSSTPTITNTIPNYVRKSLEARAHTPLVPLPSPPALPPHRHISFTTVTHLWRHPSHNSSSDGASLLLSACPHVPLLIPPTPLHPKLIFYGPWLIKGEEPPRGLAFFQQCSF